MYQLAFYGKGGIGKSTIAANISVSLAKKGLKVFQLGCDPKHDSTRLLNGGKAQGTVLNYVRETPMDERKLDDVVKVGSLGILCAEAGGPEPGIGCAGRGILTTFDALDKMGVSELKEDVRVYDVLGDVVCGGFAVPLREEYSDGIILVTSGEFMSMYAANNIMKGLLNFDVGRPRLIGIVLNSRGVEGEEELVRKFADATGTRILAVIPRDNTFSKAEGQGHTVSELYPQSELARIFDMLSDYVMKVSKGEEQCTYPSPLDDDQLKDLAAGNELGVGAFVSDKTVNGCGRHYSIRDSRIMMSCAACGAVTAYSRINDFGVLLHGPESCMFFMNGSGGKARVQLKYGYFDVTPKNNIRCSMMDDAVSIFGGIGYLEAAIERMVSEGFDKIAVITTCVPGIIGDDCISLIEKMRKKHPDVMIQYIPADGDINGDFNDGFMMAVSNIIEMLEPDLTKKENTVNLVGELFFDLHNTKNLEALNQLLSDFDLTINCRFLDETDSERIKGFSKAGIDLMIRDTINNREIYELISERVGRRNEPILLPTGLYEYRQWLDKMGELLGKQEKASEISKKVTEEYQSFIGMHRKRFEGKRFIVVNKLSYDTDWMIDVLLDLGVDLVRVGYQTASRKDDKPLMTRHPDIVTMNYESEDLLKDIKENDVDLIISDVIVPHGSIRFAKISKIGPGIGPMLDYVEYLEDMMRLPNDEGWKKV